MNYSWDWSVIWAGISALASVATFLVIIVGAILTLRQIEIARNDSRVKCTAEFLGEASSPALRAAGLALIPQAMSTARARVRARELFEVFRSAGHNAEHTAVNRDFVRAVGEFDNLYHRVAAFADRNLIDVDLWFSQQAFTMALNFAIIGELIVEPRPPGVIEPLAALARRAYLYVLTRYPAQSIDEGLREAFAPQTSSEERARTRRA